MFDWKQKVKENRQELKIISITKYIYMNGV